MTRPDNHRAKPVRVNRIERLETRHMLSADGLSFADFHDDFANELARTSRSFQAMLGSEFDLRGSERSRIGQRHGDQAARLHRNDLNHHNGNHLRSGLSDGHRERADRHFGSQGHLNDPLMVPPLADYEPVTNSDLRLGSRPLERIEPARTQSPIITSSKITFVIFLPSVSSSLSLDLGTSRSSTGTSDRTRAAPQIATADSQTAVSPAADSQPSRRADLDLTPAEQAALERAEAVQLVSIHPHNDFYAAAIAVVAAPEKLKTNPGGSSKLDFSFDAQRFEDMPLERFLEQSKSLEEDIAELEELLDAITLKRTESAQHRDSAFRPMIPAEQQTDTIVESPSEDAADGMILLLPGASLANPTAQFAAQVFDRPDDSAISQWTVGVGFYRALEVVGDARFADALIASEISINPTTSAAAENELAETFSWQLDTVSSSRQAAGVVFCCLGIQYLRNRRKETNELEIRSVPRDEVTLD